MQVYRFTARLISPGSQAPDSAYVEIPFDVKTTFGTAAQVKVNATFDDIPYQGSLAPMGNGKHVLIVIKAIFKQLGKKHGDTVTVSVEQDVEVREVTLPEDFKQLLQQHPKAKNFFDSLAYTHRKEYSNWINEAKREETRKKRLEATLKLLGEEKKSFR